MRLQHVAMTTGLLLSSIPANAAGVFITPITAPPPVVVVPLPPEPKKTTVTIPPNSAGWTFYFSKTSSIAYTDLTIEFEYAQQKITFFPSPNTTNYIPDIYRCPGVGLISACFHAPINIPANQPNFEISIYVDSVVSAAQTVTLSPSVPEATTWAMMLVGMIGLGLAGWLKRAVVVI